MLGRTTAVILGVIGIGILAACSAPNGVNRRSPGSAAATSSGGAGGGISLGGSGNGTGIGGFNGGGAGGSIPMVACDAATPCTDGICAAGFCAPNLGPCTTDSDCGGDSYCCGAGCRDDGTDPVCIPYGYGPRGTLNSECKGGGTIGVFAPSVQCEWLGPAASDPYPDSKNVLTTPLVADLPNDSRAAAEIVVVTFGAGDASKSSPGVIRILNGQTCALLESIYDATDVVRANSTPALADLNNDGMVDIVARRDASGLVAFGWDGAKFAKLWAQSSGTNVQNTQNWDGPSVHDLNNDGSPEVILGTDVYNGQTGALIYSGPSNNIFNGMIPVLADLNGDGEVELVAPVSNELTYFGWDGSKWVDEGVSNYQRLGVMASHYAVADFGTPGATAADFDTNNFDGIAEIVAVGDTTGRVTVHTLNRQIVLDVATADRGGPPTIADFDNDGRPEIAVAGKTRFRILDFDCKGAPAGCESDGVRWSQPSQDASSAQTGVAAFDFDGDGQIEAVYADECFLRVYNGLDGEVLYSAYRTSGTWYESPLVADVDRDQSTEIVVNNNVGVLCPTSGGAIDKPYVDPLHKGVRCDDTALCSAGTCVEGLCRCSGDGDCDSGMTCVAPIAGTPGSGNVCRATHPNSQQANGGIRVLRDRLDRWASSRPMWNQHAYSITNINDDGTVPKTSAWLANWKQPGLNNYRQNVQGSAGFEDMPDITGALNKDNVCVVSGNTVTLTATVCNRGAKAVGANMPATFYQGSPTDAQILCVSYTDGPVPVQGCLEVSCQIGSAVTGQITMVVNDDGMGGQTTVECNSDNNSDSIQIDECVVK